MRLLIVLMLLGLAAPALACGPDTDCVLGERTYRLYVPEAAKGAPMGALVFAHGYRGTAAGAMRNAALRDLADELGVALVALKSGGDDWGLAHTPQAPARETANEYVYVRAVLKDVGQRVALDPARTVMSGFSAGGMLTWTLACGMSDAFAGFVAMSGTFWAPEPETCTTPPASLVHFHGTEDLVVPLGGRAIGPTRQGDVAQVLAMYAAYGGFEATVEAPELDDTTCRHSANGDGKRLAFCTFPGGHSFSAARLRSAFWLLTGPA